MTKGKWEVEKLNGTSDHLRWPDVTTLETRTCRGSRTHNTHNEGYTSGVSMNWKWSGFHHLQIIFLSIIRLNSPKVISSPRDTSLWRKRRHNTGLNYTQFMLLKKNIIKHTGKFYLKNVWIRELDIQRIQVMELHNNFKVMSWMCFR